MSIKLKCGNCAHRIYKTMIITKKGVNKDYYYHKPHNKICRIENCYCAMPILKSE